MPSPNRVVLNISIDREVVEALDAWRADPKRGAGSSGYSRSKAASILLERGLRKPTRQKKVEDNGTNSG